MHDELKLENIRSTLIRLEETIIFYIIERAQFKTNEAVYQKGNVNIPGFNESFMMYLLHETERIHSTVRRYQAPDEIPFTKDLPEPIISDYDYDWPIKRNSVNVNDSILQVYVDEIIPLISEKGDDKNYGSTAVTDVAVLQAISRRIHYGKFVAEAKYLANEAGYRPLIEKKDKEGIMELLTNRQVELNLLERVYIKASTYGHDPVCNISGAKIDPEVIKTLYSKWIMPLTKEVEYLYFLER